MNLLNYLISLAPTDSIDYDYIVNELRNEAAKNQFELDWVMDWSKTKDTDVPADLSLALNQDKFKHFLEPELPAFIRNLQVTNPQLSQINISLVDEEDQEQNFKLSITTKKLPQKKSTFQIIQQPIVKRLSNLP
jgi:hypothetical protein